MSASVINKKEPKRSTTGLILLVLGIIFLAANLRAPITSVGPVVALIRDSLGISNTMVGALTTIPLLAFAVLSPFAPRLARKFGMEIVLFIVLIVLSIGLVLRPFGGISTLYLGTLLIGAGIAIANVLMPAFIKMKFSNNIGLLTGVYSVSMNLTGALAAGLSIPIASSSGFGWKGSIGVWAVLGILALIFWIPQIRHRQKEALPGEKDIKGKSLWRSHLAWKITIFMGLQSLLFYSLVAWLPVILQSRGMVADEAGWMLSYIQFSQLPFTFIVPIIAGRMKNQVPLVWITFFLMTIGLTGILFGGTTFVFPSVIVIGVGSAFAFSLAMMFFTLRTDDSFEAADLSAMAQSFGYLLAASGPPVFGLLFDLTNGWTIPLSLLMIATFAILVVGLGAAKDEYVSKK